MNWNIVLRVAYISAQLLSTAQKGRNRSAKLFNVNVMVLQGNIRRGGGGELGSGRQEVSFGYWLNLQKQIFRSTGASLR